MRFNDLIDIVREECELNDVFMDLVENRDTFTQMRHDVVFLSLRQRVCELHECEEIIQNINDWVTIVMDFVEDFNCVGDVVGP